MTLSRVLLGLLLAAAAYSQTDFDLLLKGGHVIDGRNNLNAVRDVAIKDGKIAAVAANIAASRAAKTIDASGLYVTPGLVDIHVHVYQGPYAKQLRERKLGSAAGWLHAADGRDHGR